MLHGKIHVGLIAFSVLALGACGDDDSNLDSMCEDLCRKEAQCGQNSNTNGNTNEDDCRAMCKSMADNMRPEYVRDRHACIMSHSCEELDNEVCDDAGKDKCTSAYEAAVRAQCRREIEDCQQNQGQSMDDCVQQAMESEHNQDLGCLTADALDDLKSCYETMSCDNLLQAKIDCFMQATFQ